MAKESNTGLWLAALGAVGAGAVALIAARKSAQSDANTVQGAPTAIGWTSGGAQRRGARLGRRSCGCEGDRR